MAYVLGGECRGVSMYRATRATGLLAPPGVPVCPARPSVHSLLRHAQYPLTFQALMPRFQ